MIDIFLKIAGALGLSEQRKLVSAIFKLRFEKLLKSIVLSPSSLDWLSELSTCNLKITIDPFERPRHTISSLS